MLKKTLLSLAITASTAGLTACNISSISDNNEVENTPVLSGQEGFEVSTVTPQFQPTNNAGPVVPLNIDILFADAPTTDGTANTADTTPPVTTALNKLAGFSTTAAIYMNFTGALDPDSVVAGQTVHLVKLKNAKDDPSIDALDISSIAATGGLAAADQPVGGVDYEANYITLDNGATHTIQILPKTPLEPKTKYVVAFTNGITSASGEPASASGDTLLIRSEQAIPEALQPIRSLVNVWDIAAKQANGVDDSNLILSYAFTTNSGPDILKNYAAPSLFVADQLPLASAEGLMESLNPGSTNQVAVYVATLGGHPTPADPKVIAATKLTPQYSAAIYGQISAADLTGIVGLPVTINGVVDRPSPRQVDLINSAAVDVVINDSTNAKLDATDPGNAPHSYTGGASPKTFLKTADAATRYIQGQIQLPDFLGSAKLTQPFIDAGLEGADAVSKAMASDPTWTANTTLGDILDAATGKEAGTTPPKDKDGSTNVTYRYPFPQKVGTDYAPLMITMPAAFDYSAGGSNPAGSDCTTGYDDGFPVVMYVHGITGARTNGLAYSAGLAANCIATVAIDLPLHGIAPLTSDADGNDVANELLPFTVEPGLAALTSSPYAGVAANSTVSGTTFANLTEQHDSIYQTSNGIRKAMNFDITAAEGKSGSTMINLLNFTRSRDNMQQAVVDLLNLNASLGNIDTALGGSKLDLDNVFVAGHSLGAIFATTYAAVNNDPAVLAGNGDLNKIQGVVLANGGSHITKLLENSPGFAPTILGSLAGSGLTQGSSSLEKYFAVFQAALDVVDPAMSGAALAATETPIVMFNMVGGDALPTDTDALAKISVPTGFKAGGSYLPDHTVPNFDYFADGASNPYAAFAPALELSVEAPTAKAPMAGTSGLASIMGLETVYKDTVVSDLKTPTQVVSRFSTGTHSTFANADADAAFKEMLTQSITLIKGQFTTVNQTVLKAAE